MTPFEAELRKRIQEEIDRLSGDIAAGNMADFTAYKTNCATVGAYRRVMDEFIDDAHTAVAKRNG